MKLKTVTVDYEVTCRANHWQDVAQFEQKELEKVRIFRSLRLASAALAIVSLATVVTSVLNIELMFAADGEMIPPHKA